MRGGGSAPEESTIQNLARNLLYIGMIVNDPNSKLDPQDPMRDLIQVEPQEVYGGWEGCWAGDGSGMDDLADFNQQEGQDI